MRDLTNDELLVVSGAGDSTSISLSTGDTSVGNIAVGNGNDVGNDSFNGNELHVMRVLQNFGIAD